MTSFVFFFFLQMCPDRFVETRDVCFSFEPVLCVCVCVWFVLIPFTMLIRYVLDLVQIQGRADGGMDALRNSGALSCLVVLGSRVSVCMRERTSEGASVIALRANTV